MSTPAKNARSDAAAKREAEKAARTHRVGPRVTYAGPRDWRVEQEIVIPKRGRPYYRRMRPPRPSDVLKEAEKIKKNGTASVVVMIAGIIDEDLYEGKEFIPKGSAVFLSRRMPIDNLINHLQAQLPYNRQSELILAIGGAADFKFSHISSIYIREDRIEGGVG